jgi:hypothetical protein
MYAPTIKTEDQARAFWAASSTAHRAIAAKRKSALWEALDDMVVMTLYTAAPSLVRAVRTSIAAMEAETDSPALRAVIADALSQLDAAPALAG